MMTRREYEQCKRSKRVCQIWLAADMTGSKFTAPATRGGHVAAGSSPTMSGPSMMVSAEGVGRQGQRGPEGVGIAEGMRGRGRSGVQPAMLG